jgi:hypothetical protein
VDQEVQARIWLTIQASLGLAADSPDARFGDARPAGTARTATETAFGSTAEAGSIPGGKRFTSVA